MLFFDGFFGMVMLGVWIFCIIDVITTDSILVRNLPKLVWLMIVLVLPDIGSIAWLVAGHPWQQHSTANLPYKGNYGTAGTASARLYRDRDRTGRPEPVTAGPSNPDDDAEFLAGLRARAEEQRRRAREQGDN